MPTNVGKFIEDLDGGVFEEYQKEHLQGQSGEFIRLVRMGWNARGELWRHGTGQRDMSRQRPG